METHKLKVYNRARLLSEQIVKSTGKVPRFAKYSYVDPMIVSVYGIMEYISFANDTPEQRVQFIDTALAALNQLKIKVRVLRDLKFVTQKGYDAIIRDEENVTRQLNGWRKATLGEQ